MIVETHTVEEIQKEVHKDYARLTACLFNKSKKYAKDFRSRRRRITYLTPNKVIINNNEYIAFYGSTSGSVKDFGFQLFLKLQTNRRVNYYRISAGGLVNKITSHFIERSIERSPYNCDKSNFLGYLARDLNVPLLVCPSGDVSYSPTESGFIVIQNSSYITYMSDLSKTNQSREREAEKDINKMFNRKASVEQLRKYYLESFK